MAFAGRSEDDGRLQATYYIEANWRGLLQGDDGGSLLAGAATEKKLYKSLRRLQVEYFD